MDKLAVAAYSIDKDRTGPFTAEDLVVMAWRLYPDTFGLPGYVDNTGVALYPDSNRVFAEVMGSKPLRKRGIIGKVGSKQYQLTISGRDYAQKLLEENDSSRGHKSSFSRLVKQDIDKLLNSKAYVKFSNNMGSEITFFDACSFWGISPRSSAIEFEGRVANLVSLIKALQKEIGGGSVSLKHGGHLLGEREARALSDLHSMLMEKFKEEVAHILSRKDER
jgi:hypothetical protein